MPRITYTPDGNEATLDADATILEGSLAAGIPIPNECGGNGRCSTCRVRVLKGLENCSPRTGTEASLAARLGLAQNVRLACQTRITGDVTLQRLVLDWEEAKPADTPLDETNPCPTCGERELSILFADIRGFTSFSEHLPPFDVVHILNRYFHHMGRVITRHGGFIANYMGDGLLALFGLDFPTGSPLRAAQAGLEMLETVDRLKPYFEAHHGKSFDIGIGAHYGEAVVGNVGFDNAKKLTVIGDSVNLASRMEQMNKSLSTRFLISDALYHAIERYAIVQTLEPLQFRGKTGDYLVHELLALRGDAPQYRGDLVREESRQ